MRRGCEEAGGWVRRVRGEGVRRGARRVCSESVLGGCEEGV